MDQRSTKKPKPKRQEKFMSRLCSRLLQYLLLSFHRGRKLSRCVHVSPVSRHTTRIDDDVPARRPGKRERALSAGAGVTRRAEFRQIALGISA